jgi:O-methyltransferase involved in polyketide biosynthesis
MSGFGHDTTILRRQATVVRQDRRIGRRQDKASERLYFHASHMTALVGPPPKDPLAKAPQKGDLSITALYTSETWTWGGLSCANLLATPEARAVFRVTNAVLFLAGLLRRGLPSLRHSLLHRHAMIDRLVREEEPRAVLELASGLSRRGAAFSADPALDYVEVDLPHVVAKKRELLSRTEEGRRVLDRPNFELVAADVSEAELVQVLTTPRQSRGRAVDHAKTDGPLAVIAEGLLMYLVPDAQRRLFAKVRGLFGPPESPVASGGLFVFDLVPACEQPPPGRVGRALEAMMKRFTGGRTFERDLRTRDDIAVDLRSAGFSRVEMIEPRQVAREWSLPFADARTQQLLFVCRP